jgi:hypothetical protein
MRQRPVRLVDLKPPRRIDNDTFDAICRTCEVPDTGRAALRDLLQDAVAGFASHITSQQRLPTRTAYRLAIERAIENLRYAERGLRKLGPIGRRGLNTGGRHIASAISALWMRRRFPGERAIPDTIYWPEGDSGFRATARVPSRPTDLEELFLDQRIRFMEWRGADAIPELLGDFIASLTHARNAIVQLPGGRKPLDIRRFMLAALAESWHRLGRRPTTGINSKFGAYREAVFDAIGWPTEGVNAALMEAIVLWRERYRKS